MPHSTYMRTRLGAATIDLETDVVGGSCQSFNLTYTAGFFGIHRLGGIKIAWRFSSDMRPPQFSQPRAADFVTAETSTGAEVVCRYSPESNIRPWFKAVRVQLTRGHLGEGDRIIVRFGDPRCGSPGLRMQTFCEDRFVFKVLVDAFAVCDFAELSRHPSLRIVAGAPVRWRAVLPTRITAGRPFRLGLRAEDRWGNPSGRDEKEVFLEPSRPVAGLPPSVRLEPGRASTVIDGLCVDRACDVTVRVTDAAGSLLTSSNALRVSNPDTDGVSASPPLWPFWADMHGQSNETIGTNPVDDYFRFGRDRAFLDAISHQGNDFEITREFWAELQQVCERYHEPGRYVTFPGYEWSGNTSLGGDHNVIFLRPGEPIHRSSHALLEDMSDADTDRHTSLDLFNTLKDREAFFYAHAGGRYADLAVSRDSGVTPAVEIHSGHGTFEWLLHDAFTLGLRPGIVANSDEHRGRPGACHPGDTAKTYGGLTCFLAQELSREALFDSLKKRHHYATSGDRLLLETSVDVDSQNRGIMGDIIPVEKSEVLFGVKALCAVPIERVELFNGGGRIETLRPFGPADMGNRVRVTWEGAECRDGARKTTWDGRMAITANTIENVAEINFFNPEKRVKVMGDRELTWRSHTTGGFSGIDVRLGDRQQGSLTFESQPIHFEVEISHIGFDDLVYDAGGLGRRVRLCRLPDQNPHVAFETERTISLHHGDNPIYVKLVQENGHVAWSSPIYLIRR